MISAKHIKQKKGTKDVLDLPFLKELGQNFIQKLSGHVWTDYNVHDPGVTTLEILAYGITDLGYRTRNRVPVILAAPTKESSPNDTLIPPKEILYNSPVTRYDYSKIFLAIDGVKNAHLVPSSRNPEFKGIYDLQLEIEADALQHKIKKQALALYHANRLHDVGHASKTTTEQIYAEQINIGKDEVHLSNRNLGEDIDQIHFTRHTKIRFEISLELQAGTYINQFLSELTLLLREFLSPTMQLHQVQDLMRQGMPVEQIYNGPFLPFGRIMDKEMDGRVPRNQIRSSDLVMHIHQLKGVTNLRELLMLDTYNVQYKWVCPVEKGTTPVLDLEGSQVRIYNDAGVVVHEGNLRGKRAATSDLQVLKTTHKMDMVHEAPPKSLHLEDYYSIQHEFPKVYGIGEFGLRREESPRRQAQAKQLKGYLMFFDQMLANYLAQLANLNRIYSIEAIDQSYFFQPLLDVPHAEWLYTPFITRYLELHVNMNDTELLRKEWDIFRRYYKDWLACQRAAAQQKSPQDQSSRTAYLQKLWAQFIQGQPSTYSSAVWTMDTLLYDAIETPTVFYDRRNRFLDHLLARFGIDTLAYTFTSPENPSPMRDIATKLRVLQAVPLLSRTRGLGLAIDQHNQDLADVAQSLLSSNFAGVEKTLINILSMQQVHRDHINRMVGEEFTIEELPAGSPAEVMDAILLEDCFTEDEAVQKLFAYGLAEENYVLATSGDALQIHYMTDKEPKVKQLLATITLPKKIMPSEAHQAIMNTMLALKSYGERFESLHLIEHILLRPEKPANFFGFAVYDLSGQQLLFKTDNFRSFDVRERILIKLLEMGRDAVNYEIKELMRAQYQLSINLGRETLLGPDIYHTHAAAARSLSEYVAAFEQLYVYHVAKDNTGLEDFRLFETKEIADIAPEERKRYYYEAATDFFAYGERHLRRLPNEREDETQRSRVMVEKEFDIDGIVIDFKFESRRMIGHKKEAAATTTFDDFVANNIRQLKELFLENVYRNPSIKFITRNHELYKDIDDPYSHVATVVFPSWPPRFQNEILRAYAKRMVLLEVPAHMVANVKWLPYTAMLTFEKLYVEFLQYKMQLRALQQQIEDLPHAATAMLEQERANLGKRLKELQLKISDLGDDILQLITSSAY